MHLRDALEQIDQIRTQMDRAQTFRGYRSITAALSATLAVIVAAAQLLCNVAPLQTPAAFILPWLGAALLSLLISAVEITLRIYRSPSPVQKQLSLLAAEQFLPAALAGALVTFAIYDFLPAQLSLLPGLWMIFFSLALFASGRLLPRMIFALAAYYLLSGILSLVLTPTLPPQALIWQMGLVFTAGQSAAAGILYLKLERSHG